MILGGPRGPAAQPVPSDYPGSPGGGPGGSPGGSGSGPKGGPGSPGGGPRGPCGAGDGLGIPGAGPGCDPGGVPGAGPVGGYELACVQKYASMKNMYDKSAQQGEFINISFSIYEKKLEFDEVNYFSHRVSMFSSKITVFFAFLSR